MARFKNQKSYQNPPTKTTMAVFSNWQAMVGYLLNQANLRRHHEKNLSQARREAEYINNLVDKGINPEAVGYAKARSKQYVEG